MRKTSRITHGLRAITLAAAVTIVGCATPLNMTQKQELRGWQAKGLEVKEKDPGAGAVLGLFVGAGSFYTGNIGPGIVNLLFWPLSILWDPVSGYEGALSANYYATKTVVDKKLKKEIAALEDDMISGKLSKEDFVLKKRRVEDQYSSD